MNKEVHMMMPYTEIRNKYELSGEKILFRCERACGGNKQHTQLTYRFFLLVELFVESEKREEMYAGCVLLKIMEAGPDGRHTPVLYSFLYFSTSEVRLLETCTSRADSFR